MSNTWQVQYKSQWWLHLGKCPACSKYTLAVINRRLLKSARWGPKAVRTDRPGALWAAGSCAADPGTPGAKPCRCWWATVAKGGSHKCLSFKTHKQVGMSVLREGSWPSDLYVSLDMTCSNLTSASPSLLWGILPSRIYSGCLFRKFLFFLSTWKYLRLLSQSRVWSRGWKGTLFSFWDFKIRASS